MKRELENTLPGYVPVDRGASCCKLAIVSLFPRIGSPKNYRLLLVTVLAITWLTPAAMDLSGYIALDFRAFPKNTAYSDEDDNFSASLALQPEFIYQWNDGMDNLVITPFARLDSVDEERTHFDVRELLWQHIGEDWELRAGIGKVFWGVTESRHLVDVINQTDFVEDIDGEDKLGQPMVNLSFIRDWGAMQFFLLPYFRERTFPGPDGRPRTSPPVDTEQAFYTSSGRHRLDVAIRWSRAIDIYDIGVSHFYGTARDPLLVAGTDGDGEAVLVPRYDVVHQTSIDLQATTGSWLWKLEALRRRGQGEAFHASVAGFEYTFFGAFASSADVGVLAEHLYDSRGDDVPHAFDDDMFIGLRLALNDVQSTEVLAGIIHDRHSDAKQFSFEANRRLGEQWTLEVEARVFADIGPGDQNYSMRDDDYVQISIARHV